MISKVCIQTAGSNTTDGEWDGGHIHYFTHKGIRSVFIRPGFSDVSSRELIDIRYGSHIRRVLDRFSSWAVVREFLSGNMLLVARK